MGFLRKDPEGNSSLAILNPDIVQGECIVKMVKISCQTVFSESQSFLWHVLEQMQLLLEMTFDNCI